MVSAVQPLSSTTPATYVPGTKPSSGAGIRPDGPCAPNRYGSLPPVAVSSIAPSMAPAQEIGVTVATTATGSMALTCTVVSRRQPAASDTWISYSPAGSPIVSGAAQDRAPSADMPLYEMGDTPPDSTTLMAPGDSAQASSTVRMVQSNRSTPSTVTSADTVQVPSSTVTV